MERKHAITDVEEAFCTLSVVEACLSPLWWKQVDAPFTSHSTPCHVYCTFHFDSFYTDQRSKNASFSIKYQPLGRHLQSVFTFCFVRHFMNYFFVNLFLHCRVLCLCFSFTFLLLCEFLLCLFHFLTLIFTFYFINVLKDKRTTFSIYAIHTDFLKLIRKMPPKMTLN